MKFVKSDGQAIGEAYLDGYFFGDRVLDGVKFVCVIEDNKVIVAGPDNNSKKYFEQLNPDWIDVAQDFVDKRISEKDFDIFDYGTYLEV